MYKLLQQLHVLYSMVIKYSCWNVNAVVITNDDPLYTFLTDSPYTVSLGMKYAIAQHNSAA